MSYSFITHYLVSNINLCYVVFIYHLLFISYFSYLLIIIPPQHTPRREPRSEETTSKWHRGVKNDIPKTQISRTAGKCSDVKREEGFLDQCCDASHKVAFAHQCCDASHKVASVLGQRFSPAQLQSFYGVSDAHEMPGSLMHGYIFDGRVPLYDFGAGDKVGV